MVLNFRKWGRIFDNDYHVQPGELISSEGLELWPLEISLETYGQWNKQKLVLTAGFIELDNQNVFHIADIYLTLILFRRVKT